MLSQHSGVSESIRPNRCRSPRTLLPTSKQRSQLHTAVTFATTVAVAVATACTTTPSYSICTPYTPSKWCTYRHLHKSSLYSARLASNMHTLYTKGCTYYSISTAAACTVTLTPNLHTLYTKWCAYQHEHSGDTLTSNLHNLLSTSTP